MATARRSAPPPRPNPYLELLYRERVDAARWPNHDGRLLGRLEEGKPAVVWGWRVGSDSAVARVFADGRVRALPVDHPDSIAFLEQAGDP